MDIFMYLFMDVWVISNSFSQTMLQYIYLCLNLFCMQEYFHMLDVLGIKHA